MPKLVRIFNVHEQNLVPFLKRRRPK